MFMCCFRFEHFSTSERSLRYIDPADFFGMMRSAIIEAGEEEERMS